MFYKKFLIKRFALIYYINKLKIDYYVKYIIINFNIKAQRKRYIK